jgi:transposase-like protein
VPAGPLREAVRDIWADGIYANIRLEDEANSRQCLLVIMEATADGEKELIAVIDGYRESKQSWLELLLSLKRGLTIPPKLATGDGALGFWAALREVFPATREQRCWVHKTANVLNHRLFRQVPANRQGSNHDRAGRAVRRVLCRLHWWPANPALDSTWKASISTGTWRCRLSGCAVRHD